MGSKQSTPNIEKLKSPPIIGELYSVPCMFGQIDLLTKGQIKPPQWWPVMRPSHQDSVYIAKFRSIFDGEELVDEEYFENDPNFPHHYHVDPRFAPNSFYTEWEVNAAPTNPESLHNVINIQGEIKWETMPCLREMPTQRLFTGFGQKFLDDHLGKKIKCNRCPHRGVLLNSIPTIDGIITCPNHGLRFDAKTKTCVKF
jgi:hypothetical protein